MHAPNLGWRTLLAEWGRDLQLWAFIVISLQLFRLLLIVWFSDQLGDRANLPDLLAVMGVGLRFDISTAAIWVLPTFLFAIAVAWLPWQSASRWLRQLSLRLYVVVAMLIFAADLVYVDEYGDQFNQTLFGIVHDDTRAILITVWKEYHPLLLFGSVALLSFVVLRLAHYWFRIQCRSCQRVGHIQGWGWRMLTVIGIVFLLIAMGRGGTLWGEPIRLKHAFVANDLFLNRTVINPFSALRLAIETHQQLQKGAGLEMIWPGGDLQEAAKLVAGERAIGTDEIDALLSRTAPGAEHPPKHIFVVLMESHSGWPLMPAYRDLGFSPELTSLAKEGHYFPNFLPASSGTIGSMNAIIAGLPDAGLHINYEAESTRPYPYALAALFSRLGYRTRFFYGGFLSWQRLDTFAQAQGFDELYGGGSMSANSHTNEWGVDDAVLFDYILDTVKQESEQPSLNFILTTSNHPPYDLDLDAIGFPFERLPAPLQETKAETMTVLGHLWYADQQVGRFVRSATQQLPSTLFALTGDHTARLQIRFPGANVYEQYAVPLLLYSKSLLPDAAIDTTPGSHIDIIPTLVDLCAPQGFEYASFGQNMLRKPPQSVGYGFNLMINKHWIATTDQPPKIYRLSVDQGVGDVQEKVSSEQRKLKAQLALSWQRVKRGNRLSTSSVEDKE